MNKAIRYDDSFKKEAVHMYIQGDLSATAVAKKLGIDRHNFYRWIKQFNNGVVVSPKTMINAGKPLCPITKNLSDNYNVEDFFDTQAIYCKIIQIENELLLIKKAMAHITENKPSPIL